MRIPIYYIVIGVIAIGVVWGTRNKVAGINQEAGKKSQAQREQNIEDYKEGVKNIKDARWAVQRGWRFLQSGDTERALYVLKRANELDANYRDAAVYLGYARLEIVKNDNRDKDENKRDLTAREKWEEVKQAKEILLTAQKLDPLYPLTNQLLGIACEQLGDDKAALAWYSRFKEVSAHD